MNRDILFLENLYTLLDAGYSINESLTICFDILHFPYIHKMQEDLKNGEDLTVLLQNSHLPRMFKEYFAFYQNKHCLSLSIKKSLDIVKTQNTFIQNMKRQLSYPLLLLVFLICFSIFVIVFLLPQVQQMFVSFQIEQTLFLRIVFTMFYIVPFIVVCITSMFIIMCLHLYYGLKNKRHAIIEFYLKTPIIQMFLKQYFSLKFCIYYHELCLEGHDCATIIAILNQQMVHSDLKIVLYEIENRLYKGESIEFILKDFEYFEELFLTFFEMYLKNPLQYHSLEHYIDLTYQSMSYHLQKFMRYLIPFIYGFVATFVVTIYISIVLPMMNIISDI